MFSCTVKLKVALNIATSQCSDTGIVTAQHRPRTQLCFNIENNALRSSAEHAISRVVRPRWSFDTRALLSTSNAITTDSVAIVTSFGMSRQIAIAKITASALKYSTNGKMRARPFAWAVDAGREKYSDVSGFSSISGNLTGCRR